MQDKVRTILIGTPEFAKNVFRKFYASLKDKFEIIAVITAQDKPVGRKQILTPSPVKKWANENNLPILQPDKIGDYQWIEKIKKINPELIILTAFGQIIPEEILNIPKYKAINIHPSLLPKYRGASPIQSVILHGETKTGVCLMVMDKEMDHGEIISNLKFSISNKSTYTELAGKLSDLGAELLIKTLPGYIDGKIKPQKQYHAQATFCKIIKKEDAKINWNKPAIEIERLIRALKEWPTAYGLLNGQEFKILEAETNSLTFLRISKKIGEIFLTEDKQLAVQTKDKILILKTIQLESKKVMPAKEFLNGHPGIIGTILQ